MSDIKREEIQKIIDELERRGVVCGLVRESGDFYAGKSTAYRQSARLLRDLLDRAPDSPDPGGLY